MTEFRYRGRAYRVSDDGQALTIYRLYNRMVTDRPLWERVQNPTTGTIAAARKAIGK